MGLIIHKQNLDKGEKNKRKLHINPKKITEQKITDAVRE